MTEEHKVPEQLVLTRLMRLNAVVQGVVIGLVCGIGVFVATAWLVIKGGERVGPHLSLLNQYFLGYSVTWPGSFIGFGYGLVVGFLVGYVVARLYNWIVDFRESRRGQA